MRIRDYVLLGLLILWLALALYRIIKRKKNGGGCCCSYCPGKGCRMCGKKKRGPRRKK